MKITSYSYAILFFIFLTCLLSGCSYSVPAKISPAVNIYSSYEEKIPGKFFLVIDNDMNNIQKKVSPNSYTCSAHSYLIDAKDAFSSSIRSTIQNIFSEIITAKEIPTSDVLNKQGCSGVIFVRMNRFEPRIRFITGFWSTSAIADSDLVFEIEIKTTNGKTLLNTTAGASKTTEGEGGEFCNNGADILSKNIYEATREAMERIAERLANSSKTRQLASSINPAQPTKPIEKNPIPNTQKEVDVKQQHQDSKCYTGVSDNYPDNDAINMAEALTKAKHVAIKSANPDYATPNSISIERDFEKLFGSNYKMEVTKRTKNKIWMRICLPSSN